MSVCLSVCLSVQTITFEPFHIGTSFLVWRYILTISRSHLSTKVIGSRSRSCAKKWLFAYFNLLFLCMWLHVINKVKVTYQGKGHTSRSRSNQGQYQIGVILRRDTLTRVVCIWIKCVLVLYMFTIYCWYISLQSEQLSSLWWWPDSLWLQQSDCFASGLCRGTLRDRETSHQTVQSGAQSKRQVCSLKPDRWHNGTAFVFCSVDCLF